MSLEKRRFSEFNKKKRRFSEFSLNFYWKHYIVQSYDIFYKDVAICKKT